MPVQLEDAVILIQIVLPLVEVDFVPSEQAHVEVAELFVPLA